MFHSSNVFIISVVNIARLSVHPLFLQNPYCDSENFLFFTGHQDMHIFIILSNALYTHDAKDVGLALVL